MQSFPYDHWQGLPLTVCPYALTAVKCLHTRAWLERAHSGQPPHMNLSQKPSPVPNAAIYINPQLFVFESLLDADTQE